jgi:hypothetical protein
MKFQFFFSLEYTHIKVIGLNGSYNYVVLINERKMMVVS